MKIARVDAAPSVAGEGRGIEKRIISSAVAFAVLASLCLVLLLAPPSVEVVSASPDPDNHLYDFREEENYESAWEYTVSGSDYTPDLTPSQVPTSGVPAEAGDNDALESSNDTRWTTQEAVGYEEEQYFRFDIQEDVSAIDNFKVTWEGYGNTDVGLDAYAYVWRVDTSEWEQIAHNTNTEATFTWENDNADRYIDEDGELWVSACSITFEASCPVLYTWNGENWETIWEINANGGLGFFFKGQDCDNLYQEPFRLSSSIIEDWQLVSEDEVYKVKISEELPELCYFDDVKLQKVYHPRGTRLFTNLPVKNREYDVYGSPWFFVVSDIRLPIAAWDDENKDILSQVIADDGIWTEKKTEGVWKQLTFDFGDLSNAENLILIIKPEVDWYEGVEATRYLSHIEVWNGSDWERVDELKQSLPEAGGPEAYPQMPVAMDITNWFPENITEYRLRFNDINAKKYDYVWIATSAHSPYLIENLSLLTANLYQEFEPQQTFSGYFARYGEVKELLENSDDIYVIMNKGDAIELSYDRTFNLLDVLVAFGLIERSYVLLSEGYYKAEKMTEYTLPAPLSVKPLPFKEMTTYPYPENESFPWDEEHLEWWNEYQTRYIEPEGESHNTLYTDFISVNVYYAPLLTQPQLYLPENESAVDNCNPYFEWTNGNGADSHNFVLDDDLNFGSIDDNHIFTGSDNSHTIPVENTLTSGKTYYWKVIAINPSEENESGVFNFSVKVYPTQPQLYLPENADNVDNRNPYFEWTNGENAENHNFVLDDDSGFGSIDDNYYATGSENSHTIPAENTLTQGTVYYWKVIAINENGETESGAFNFSVKVYPTQPQLYLPVNNENLDNHFPVFEWTIGENADNHRILVDDDADCLSPIDNENLGAAENTWTKSGSGYEAGDYYWQVIAWNENGENASVIWKFTNLSPTVIWSYYDSGCYAVDVDMSADGRQMAGGTELNYKVYYWDNTDNIPDWTYTATTEVKELDMSDDGRYIAAAFLNDGIKLFDNDDNVPIWTYSMGSGAPVVSVSSDGARIVGSLGGYVRLWNNVSSTPIWSYKQGTYSRGSKVSADGQYVIAAFENYIIKFTDDDNTPVWTYHTQYGIWSAEATISDNGDYCAVTVGAGSQDPPEIDWGYLYLFGEDNNPIWTYDLAARPGLPNPLDITSSGHRISARDGNDIVVFGNEDNTKLWSWGLGAGPWSSDIHDSGEFLAVGSGTFGPPEEGYFWFFSIGEDKLYNKYDLASLGWDLELSGDASRSFASSDHSRTFFYFETNFSTPSSPTLVSPDNGTDTSDNTPTFQWTKGTGATSHRLLVDNDDDFSTPNENRTFAVDNTYTIVDENSLPLDDYYWKVVAINALGENESETWVFKVAKWQLIETWTGAVESLAAWQLIETWTGTVQAPAEWQLIETWTGTVSAPAAWQLIETWTGAVESLAAWQLIETWTGTIETLAVAAWQLIETWTGTVQAPAEWQLIETWTGTVQAPAEWQLIETWTGTVQAPAEWQLIETWTGTVSAPAAWQLIETWTGAVESLAAWQLIETWTGAVEAPRVWRLIETWTSTVEAPSAVVPDFTISINPTSNSVQQGGRTTATVTITSINNYSLTVSLDASGQPSDMTVSFSPSSGIPNFNSTMTINVGSNAPAGYHTITITGTGADGKVRTCTYVLTITAVTPPPPPPPPPSPGPTPPSPTQPPLFFYTMLSIAVGIAGFAAAYYMLARPSKHYIMLKQLKRAVVKPKARRIGKPPARPPVKMRKKVSRKEAAALRRLKRIARERKMKLGRKRRR